MQHAAGHSKLVSKMPTSLSLFLPSALLVLAYSAPKYYLIETEDGLEGTYIKMKNLEISIQVNQVKVLMTMGLCAHHHRWVSHQGWAAPQ